MRRTSPNGLYEGLGVKISLIFCPLALFWVCMLTVEVLSGLVLVTPLNSTNKDAQNES